MPIRCYQRSKSRGLPVILLHFLSPTASIFPHLCPQKEMLHRRFDHAKGAGKPLMQQSTAPRDERWKTRYDDIPRIVDSAWSRRRKGVSMLGARGTTGSLLSAIFFSV